MYSLQDCPVFKSLKRWLYRSSQCKEQGQRFQEMPTLNKQTHSVNNTRAAIKPSERPELLANPT